MVNGFQDKVSFIWSVADLLRHDYKPYEYQKVILPLKRHEISEDHIRDLTKLHGEFREGKHCKIFRNEDFGYQRITVERPLKLRFQATGEAIDRFMETSAYLNLVKTKKKGAAAEAEIVEGREAQLEYKHIIAGVDQTQVFTNREAFVEALEKSRTKQKLPKIPQPILKAILEACGERDENADVCLNKDGNPEPDPDLRDNENVPLTEDIHEYVKREVLPHVPDAWVDEEKTKIGFEIPFTRHFYEYTPPRPLEEIEGEIKKLEGEIQRMLEEVMG